MRQIFTGITRFVVCFLLFCGPAAAAGAEQTTRLSGSGKPPFIYSKLVKYGA